MMRYRIYRGGTDIAEFADYGDAADYVRENDRYSGLKIYDVLLGRFIAPKYHIMAEDGSIVGYADDAEEAERMAEELGAYALDNSRDYSGRPADAPHELKMCVPDRRHIGR